MTVEEEIALEEARSSRKAYMVALSLFAVEVVLLYLFTLRFL
jgi:hypothetical protein